MEQINNSEVIVPTARDLAMSQYLAPKTVDEENLVQMCYEYIKRNSDETIAKSFLNNINVSMYLNANEKVQMFMLNKYFGETLVKHRASNDNININRVLLNIDNNLPKQSWFNIITSGVISFFITNKLSFA